MDDLLTGRVRVTPLLAEAERAEGVRLMGWELDDVEKPFVAQLQALGWAYIEGSLDDPGAHRPQQLHRGDPGRRAARAPARPEPWPRWPALAGRCTPVGSRGRHHPARHAQADGGQPEGHRAADQGADGRGPARLGRRARPDHPLHRLGHAGQQPLHGRQPVPRRLPARLQQRQGLHRARPGAAGERPAAGGGGVQEPVHPRAAGRGRGPTAPLQQPAQGRLRDRRQRGQRGAVRHQPAAGGHQLRRGAGGLRRRGLRALRAVEDGGRPGRHRQRDRGGRRSWASPACRSRSA